MDRSFKPNVTVAAIVEREGRFLVVEEETAEGVRLNQPAGHLELGESLVDAAVRETMEETAHQFVPSCVVGVYRWPRPQGDLTYLRFAFGGTADPAAGLHRLDDGIVRALWMSFDDLRASVARHRSPLVLQCCADWISGRRFPLDLVRDFTA
ncbi:NUDIX hydrolase [Rhodocyclaceae bacterium SMB388]